MKDEDKRITDALENLMDIQAEVAAEEFAKNLIDTIEQSGDGCEEYNQRIPLIYMKMIEKLQEHLEKISGEVKVEK